MEQQRTGVSRRRFLTIMAGTGAVGAMTLSGCSPVKNNANSGWLPTQYRSQTEQTANVRGRVPISEDDLTIVRDDEKCILCGQCIEACEKVQSVYGYYELPTLDDVICVHCGQCTLWCPTASITERFQIDEVEAAIADDDKIVIVSPSPSTRVCIGEEFGMATGEWAEGKLVTSFKEVGFDHALDINFGADMTITEEAAELVQRLTTGGTLPMFTSCCAGWVKFVEYYYPELLPHLSSARSPISMQGPLIKTYYAEKLNIDPEKIVTVTVAPCVDKKFEIAREEFQGAAKYHNVEGMKDNDIVLSIREYADMLRRHNIDFASLPDTPFDPIMGAESGAAIIFGNTGGVMEAAARTAYFYATGQQPPEAFLNLEPVRGLEGIKRATVHVPGVGDLKVVVCHGLANARRVLDEVKAGKADFHFMEVMACPGGCISGGGTPRAAVPPQDWVREARIKTLYDIDAEWPVRNSHDNPEIKDLYKDFIGEPLSHLAHDLLHTHYMSRADKLVAKEPKDYPPSHGI